MKKQLTEQQVLDLLDIPDFRHLSKDKLMKFTSSLPDMEPSVAISALQQFPKFAETSIEIIECYKQIVGKELDHNADNMKSFNDTCQVVIVSLQSLLDKDDLTFEEKNKVIDKMMSVLQIQADKDSENKKWQQKILFGLGAIVTVAVGLLAASIGANAEIKTKNDDEDAD